MNATQLARLFAFTTVFAAAAAAAPSVLAQTDGSALSRAEVKQQTRAANQAGQLLAAGEVNAASTPAPMASTRTREQRKAETLTANRNGGLGSPGQALYKGYNVAPRLAIASSTKTRAERKAETMQAIRMHQLMPAGEAG
jgi:hypothetical protein